MGRQEACLPPKAVSVPPLSSQVISQCNTLGVLDKAVELSTGNNPVHRPDTEVILNCQASAETLDKKCLKLNLNCQPSPSGIQKPEAKPVTKPLPYEISKILHKRGYPKVATKFASII